MGKPRILILGGTTEARLLCERLAGRTDIDVLVSLAGRTAEPKPLPVPTRIGGFGGVEGLAAFLREGGFVLLIDATHPFAAQISTHAYDAALRTGIQAFQLKRPGWSRMADDKWRSVDTIEGAVATLGDGPCRVFLAIGRQEAARFSGAPQHSYLVRSVDPVDPKLDVPDCSYILSSGPFRLDDEIALLAENRIDVIVTKNSGGAATYAKIEAARQLGLDVIMIERPQPCGLSTVENVASALALINQAFSPA
jgi:precorrin-6A/cobalt-precorrin-6A reductase